LYILPIPPEDPTTVICMSATNQPSGCKVHLHLSGRRVHDVSTMSLRDTVWPNIPASRR
jgi:hypothetical protein